VETLRTLFPLCVHAFINYSASTLGRGETFPFTAKAHRMTALAGSGTTVTSRPELLPRATPGHCHHLQRSTREKRLQKNEGVNVAIPGNRVKRCGEQKLLNPDRIGDSVSGLP
jgi:hypothetical protein